METATVQAEESVVATCDGELSEAMNALGAIGASYYHDYVTQDAAVMTSECQSIDEIIANSVVSDDTHNNDDDNNEYEPQDSGEILDTSFFGEAVAALDLLCRYVAPQHDAKSNMAFQTMEQPARGGGGQAPSLHSFKVLKATMYK